MCIDWGEGLCGVSVAVSNVRVVVCVCDFVSVVV